MSTIKDIFALEDEDELCGLLTNAGFQCVEIAIVAAISEDMKEPLLEVAQEDDAVIPFHAFFARAVGPKVDTSQVLRSRNCKVALPKSEREML